MFVCPDLWLNGHNRIQRRTQRATEGNYREGSGKTHTLLLYWVSFSMLTVAAGCVHVWVVGTQPPTPSPQKRPNAHLHTCMNKLRENIKLFFSEFPFSWNMRTQRYLSLAGTCTYTHLWAYHSAPPSSFLKAAVGGGGEHLMSLLIIPPDRHEILPFTKHSLCVSSAFKHFWFPTFSNCALICLFVVFDSALMQVSSGQDILRQFFTFNSV